MQFSKRTLLEPIETKKHADPESEKIKMMSHGVKMERKESAVDVLSPNNQNPLLIEREMMRERMYHRKEHQPLGQPAPSDIVLPEFTKDNRFRFGKLTHKGALILL
jgi:hypothetical protein